MKKVVLVLVILLLLQIVFAYEIKLTKETYWPGETLQAEITGLDNIKEQNIFLIRDSEKIPVIYDFTKIGEKHHLYMILPSKTGNHSIRLEDVLIDNENIGDVEESFVIKSTNQSYLSVNPGFIIAEEEFSINVKNKGSVSLEVNADYGGQKKSVTLVAGQEKKIRFDVETGEEQLIINDYEIPVIITKEKIEEEPIQLGNLKIIPNLIDSEILTGEKTAFRFTLINAGDEKIKNISINYPDNYNLIVEPDFISELDERDTIKGEISLKLEKEKEIEFEIIVESEDGKNKAELFVKIEVKKEEISKPSTGFFGETCEEMNGKICNWTIEICDGTRKWADDGDRCCIGKCVEKKDEDRGWLGWTIIIIVIVVVGGFLLIKWKKSKSKTAADVMKERQKK